MKQLEALRKFCADNDLPYQDHTEELFFRYSEMLIEKNKVMNLTAVTEIPEIEKIHFIDSLAAAPMIREAGMTSPDPEQSVIDIGTGAGFPGLPLSFVLPDVQFVLADALTKRIGFLQEVIHALQLTNVKAIHGRAEDLGQGPDREAFDFCVSRAVAETSVLLEYCMPMVKVGGSVILYKSGDYKEELENAAYAISVLGGELSDVKEFNLADSTIRRSLIRIRKVEGTPGRYPRRAGKPAKRPLVIR